MIHYRGSNIYNPEATRWAYFRQQVKVVQSRNVYRYAEASKHIPSSRDMLEAYLAVDAFLTRHNGIDAFKQLT